MSSHAVQHFNFSAQGCWQSTTGALGKVGSALSDGASKVGTMFYNGGNHIVLWLQGTGASIADWMKGIATWSKEHARLMVYSVRDGFATAIRGLFKLARDTYEYAAPQIAAFATSAKQAVTGSFASARNFLRAHPTEATWLVVGVFFGVLLTLAIDGLMRRSELRDALAAAARPAAARPRPRARLVD